MCPRAGVPWKARSSHVTMVLLFFGLFIWALTPGNFCFERDMKSLKPLQSAHSLPVSALMEQFQDLVCWHLSCLSWLSCALEVIRRKLLLDQFFFRQLQYRFSIGCTHAPWNISQSKVAKMIFKCNCFLDSFLILVNISSHLCSISVKCSGLRVHCVCVCVSARTQMCACPAREVPRGCGV